MGRLTDEFGQPLDHHDDEGKPCTLDNLCRTDPAWAANRIRSLNAELAGAERVPFGPDQKRPDIDDLRRTTDGENWWWRERVTALCDYIEYAERVYSDDVIRHHGELKAAWDSEKKAHAEADLVKRAALERTPQGTQLCYLVGDALVLLGDPDPDEDPEAPGAHNCDVMGCGTLSHVKERRGLTAEQMERLGRGERVGLTQDKDPLDP